MTQGGTFPERVAWKQGMGYYIADVDTGEAIFTFDNPGVPDVTGAGSAVESFRVKVRDNDGPTDRKLKMGAVNARYGNTITYRGSKGGGKRKGKGKGGRR